MLWAMARADLIVGLVKAARSGDDPALRRTVDAMIAEERAQQHHVVADRLERALQNNNGTGAPVAHAEATELAAPGIRVVTPQRTLGDLILNAFVRDSIAELVDEQRQVELLRSYGLEPRHRVLLTGPPGNGKTSVGESIAEALVVPLFQVRYEAVVGSYLGETAAQLARLFSFARRRRCVLFFDEFDAIAKERGDVHETGEIKRVVSTLLLQVDELPSHVVFVGASNHPELLDRAVSRRFQVHLTLDPPEPTARLDFFQKFLRDVLPRGGKMTPAAMARATEGASFSQLEDLALDIRRQQVLRQSTATAALIRARLKRWKQDTGL
jgi:SpoVK/Ycf46/Vps4 family AAA+-type ATPase